MTEYPKDEFDDIEQRTRVGAHRSAQAHFALWKVLVSAAIACVVIIAAGVGILQLIKSNNDFSEDTSSSASSSTGSVDRGTQVTVMTIETNQSAAAAAENSLEKLKWTSITSATSTGTSTPAKTTIIVNSSSLAATGRQLAKDLGVGQVAVSKDSPRPITVSLGKDYKASASGSSSSSAKATSTATATKKASASASASSSASTSKVDKSTRVTVLNATSTTGLAASKAKTLRNAGWTVSSVTNASSKLSTSTVYYRSSDDSASAKAVADKLDISRVRHSSAYSAAITVVIGSDQN